MVFSVFNPPDIPFIFIARLSIIQLDIITQHITQYIIQCIAPPFTRELFIKHSTRRTYQHQNIISKKYIYSGYFKLFPSNLFTNKTCF
ncbi:hypothetical protein FOB73_16175 [Yersinia pseudotuberculosis]|nr:hypothetical protein FOB73_16175 [Yersinia pseudotuberculosis]